MYKKIITSALIALVLGVVSVVAFADNFDTKLPDNSQDFISKGTVVSSNIISAEFVDNKLKVTIATAYKRKVSSIVLYKEGVNDSILSKTANSQTTIIISEPKETWEPLATYIVRAYDKIGRVLDLVYIEHPYN